MSSDQIKQTALSLIAQYGEDAETIAVLRAAEYAAMGDQATLAEWDEIIAAIAAFHSGSNDTPLN